MSLRVWLPLTKDLRNQGLDDVTVTNNGATFNSAGKLGGCYSFGPGNSYITVDSTPLKTFTEFSFACWIKIISWNTSYSTIFAAKDSTSVSWNNLIFSLLRNSTNSTLCFNISNGSNYTSTNCQTSALSLNTWYHITCTYKNGQIKLYQDGNVVSTYNTSVVPNFNSIVNLWIGKSNESSYQSNNLLNDVRIYDHCLSPMEVKQISQGLVLHYPLNRQSWGQENLLKNSGDLTLWNKESGINCEYDSTVNMYKIYSTTRESSRWGIYQDYAVTVNTDTDYTFSLTGKTDGYTAYLSFGAGTGWPANYTAFTSNKQRLSKTLTIPAGTTNIRVYLAMYPQTGGGYVYFEKPKLEEGSIATPWCPNSSDALATTMGLNSTTEYDCSGFCNNGTRTGIFTWTSDTPKYQVSTSLNNNTSKLHISGLSTSGFGNSYSIAWWGKTNSFSGLMQWGFSDGIRLNGIFNGNLWNTGDSANNPLYIPGTTTQVTVPTTNEWHHFVMVGDGSTSKVYKDGELWGQAKTYKAISGTSIYFNGWDSGTSYSNNNGYSMSDFRIYATALSADDVKSLYQNSAYIDSSGNVYGTIHES